MSLNLGTRTAHAQIFGGEIEAIATVKSDSERFAVLMQTQFRRPGRAHRQSSVMWPSSITFFHFTYSSLVKAALSARFVPRGVRPNLAKDALSSLSWSALLMAPLILA